MGVRPGARHLRTPGEDSEAGDRRHGREVGPTDAAAHGVFLSWNDVL
jgi:hypothetical protein